MRKTLFYSKIAVYDRGMIFPSMLNIDDQLHEILILQLLANIDDINNCRQSATYPAFPTRMKCKTYKQASS